MGQADNPWAVLGLERTSDMQASVALAVAYTLQRVVARKADTKAAVQAVKRQWRSLAKQFHPDL